MRLTVAKGESVPSISGVYFAALLIENETQDHFGVTFDGLVLDFGSRLYLEEEVKKYPFCKISNIKYLKCKIRQGDCGFFIKKLKYKRSKNKLQWQMPMKKNIMIEKIRAAYNGSLRLFGDRRVLEKTPLEESASRVIIRFWTRR